jgi:hypothetical protein
MFRFSIVLFLGAAMGTLACQAVEEPGGSASSAAQGGHPDGDEARERAGSNCFTCHSQFSVAGTKKTYGRSCIRILTGIFSGISRLCRPLMSA